VIRGAVFSPKQIVTIAATWLSLAAHPGAVANRPGTLGWEASGNGCRVRLMATNLQAANQHALSEAPISNLLASV
jgi:hypothetical protein